MNSYGSLQPQENFQQPLRQADDAFSLLCYSPRARLILFNFQEKLNQGEIEIRPFDRERLKISFPLQAYRGIPEASFTYDGKKGIVSLQFGMERGLAAPLLMHEILHALDENFLQATLYRAKLVEELRAFGAYVLDKESKNLSKPSTEILLQDCSSKDRAQLLQLRKAFEKFDHQMTFESEKIAYREQYKIMEELFKNIPFYRGYLQRFREYHNIVLYPVSDDQIIYRYRLNPAYLAK